ncbi:MAG: elongation factor 4 [Candidatus Sungiibacteriota bacterium]|uniref:Elongation factor 4 n=1 Tax=Candidatus Sungiibacteriota bacterium TaxID=2750080 RepID=A0A7T5RJ49_9BACT|nr:MAG: elongation factor 4 [Candidatus Sungbacteria bacterium]
MDNNIRNFVIIAHIDHGKSTLADRFLELTGTVEKRRMREQFLDTMALERERGITIKMAPVRMGWQGYTFNLIDTPGHVDFTYEVSRALAAVEGAILLVDATQGIQAQTLANFQLAQKEGLVVIPAINKIDLPSAEIVRTEAEFVSLLGALPEDIYKISAKTGEGVEELLRAVIKKVPPPQNKNEEMLRALIFDSHFDPYQGVIAYVRIREGFVKKGERIFFLATNSTAEILETGVFMPERVPKNMLSAGEIGFLATGVKETERVRVGDTIAKNKSADSLTGYREPQAVVFASIFPENQDDYEPLRESLKKLKLNDAALTFEPEESGALGRGMRSGFLGVLHMEIVAERLRREYGLKVVFTNPSVAFRVKTKSSEDFIYSAAKMPQPHEIEWVKEPWVRVEVITPKEYLGTFGSLVSEKSGKISDTSNLAGERLLFKFEAPLREIIVDFYDKLKSVSQGFASMSYEIIDYRPADLVRMEILVAGQNQPALAEIVPRGKVYFTARERVQKLKELLPRELFAVAIQAEVEGRIIARETVPALKKDVTGYLYGGDRTRKMKLWKKQQKGKKKLKSRGRVEIPPEIFLKLLKK